MPKYYFIDKQHKVTEVDKAKSNWLIINHSDVVTIENITQKYQLPKEIFIGISYPEAISRVEYLPGTKLANAFSLVLLNLSSNSQKIEERLTPISFVVSDDLLITCVENETMFIESLVEKYQTELISFEKVIAYTILNSYMHFVKELKKMKQEIDSLDEGARRTTENEELYKQADLERAIVYIDHTLRDQKETLDELWEVNHFAEKLADDQLLYDVKLRQRQTEKMISIYRDLLESIGNLFSGMMDNHLNHLMKYLDSATLVISVPAMIAGIWGMNTGGLPGRSSELGFLLVLIGSAVATAAVALHLLTKDYTK
ncbi:MULTISPECIES: magnesium transporter CorA family protein [Enterococcus]|uniref:Magnesium transporter n=1 Tax=Enterococcus thailandicus TaxID=417368 RepID=A0A179EU98_ENTTH|nr:MULTISPECIES: magnesium transporter CorA family protein [Enterococcus]ASZ07701.1 magnesium transporter [Enterococcus thailandicus]MDA3965655.1 magnesium transporter CorA family protein [Enterococcus thailandicus]MDK4350947.1 magnesium transporter CorA family protein [Enterococcus thailandicus]MDT2733399.1 magnesium transporter CorA family protein [Enterococcus thailandicus]MDT2750604.1 magnesium transporter CorA family protein [Enterococcus thailandicus]